MAWAKRFKHDVFVSYAHADDKKLPGVARGWVAELFDGIEIGLGYKGLRDHSVWMDHALAGNVDLSQQLIETLNDSAALVVVLSPAYLASEWCATERNAFLDAVRSRRDAGSQVFVVERDRVGDQRPSAFHGLRGYRFWAEDSESRRSRPLAASRHDEYHNALDSLCYDLATELNRIKAEADPTPTAAAPAAGDETHTVFLAEVTDDIDNKREEVRRFLQQSNVRILPAEMYPLAPDQFRSAAAEDLARANLFVQLLSHVPGRRGFVRLQHELAAASGKPVLQWRPPELDLSAVESEEHRTVLSGTTVRAEGLESFKNNIMDFLRRPKEEPPPTSLYGSALVFVNRESQDHELGRQVCDVLEGQGVAYSLPLSSGTPAEIRKDLELNLESCDAVIIVYGVATIRWVRSQLLQHRKILARRTENLKAFAVFRGRAQDHVDLDLNIPGIEFVPVGPDDLQAKVGEFVRLVEGYDR